MVCHDCNTQDKRINRVLKQDLHVMDGKTLASALELTCFGVSNHLHHVLHVDFPFPRFIGLDNYLRMFNDARLIRSLRATFYFAFASVPLRLIFALAVAMLLYKSSKMMGIYRAMYYLPSILGSSVMMRRRRLMDVRHMGFLGRLFYPCLSRR